MQKMKLFFLIIIGILLGITGVYCMVHGFFYNFYVFILGAIFLIPAGAFCIAMGNVY